MLLSSYCELGGKGERETKKKKKVERAPRKYQTTFTELANNSHERFEKRSWFHGVTESHTIITALLRGECGFAVGCQVQNMKEGDVEHTGASLWAAVSGAAVIALNPTYSLPFRLGE